MADAREIYTAKPTQEEMDELLGRRLAAAVGTLNGDGSIHLSYVIFLWEDGRFFCETSSVTRKARNLAVRPTASFLLDGTASTGRSVMLEAEGIGRLITGAPANEVNRRLRAKYITAEAIDDVDRVWGSLDDVAVEITPHRWRSWTGAAFAAATGEAVGGAYADIWRTDG